MVDLAYPGDRKPDTVALLVADDEDRLLLFWHARYRFWTVPLGKVEHGELDVAAAEREAFEELGIVAPRVELFDIIHKPPNLDDHSNIIIALCRVTDYAGPIVNREPEKHLDLQFLHTSRIRDLHPLSYPTQVIAARLAADAGTVRAPRPTG